MNSALQTATSRRLLEDLETQNIASQNAIFSSRSIMKLSVELIEKSQNYIALLESKATLATSQYTGR